MSIIHRKGILQDGIGSELVRSDNGGRRKILSAWLGDLATNTAQTLPSGDATPSVLNGTSFVTAGSITITNFDDGVEGQVITVMRGSADISIADNSTIDPVLAGAVTLTATHPLIQFRLASGVWKEVQRVDSPILATGSSTARTLADWMAGFLGSSAFTSGDATPSVLNGVHFRTAGSTAITNFDDGVEGQIITVFWGGTNIVITDNATIETVLNTNLSLTATRPSITLRLASGVWKEVAGAGLVSESMTPVVQAPSLGVGLNTLLAARRAVATYAALTALTAATGLADDGVYVTAARGSDEDGGFGAWRYDAASTTTANGGTILAIDGGGAGRFFRLYTGGLRPEWFGVLGNGVTDDRAAWQSCVNALSAISGGFIDASNIGNSIVSAAINFDRPVLLRGSRGKTFLYTTSATAAIFYITVESEVADLTCSVSGTTRTAGNPYIDVTSAASFTRLVNLACTSFATFIRSAATGIEIIRPTFRNGIATDGIGIEINGGLAAYIDSPVSDNSSQIAAGIKVTECGDCVIIAPNLVHCGKALYAYAAAGKVIASIDTIGGYYDTSSTGADLFADGGSIRRAMFDGVWFGSSTGDNVRLRTASGGTIDGADFNNCENLLAGDDGISVEDSGVLNFRWNGGYVAQNTGDGFSIASSVTDFAIQGVRCGSGFGLTGNANGIVLGGSNDNYSIVDNDLRGNVTAALTGGVVGASKIIRDNLGLKFESPRRWRTLAASAAALAHTGDTGEHTFATIALAAGEIGANGMLRIWTLWTFTNSGNNKTLRARLGSTALLGVVQTTQATMESLRTIRNRNSEASQVTFQANDGRSLFQTTAAPTTGAENTANALNLTITGQLANSGETITLESYEVEVMYGA